MDTLNLIRTFREVALRGNFSVAAKTMGISKANVSKHVSALEDRLDVRLLNRSTRSVSMTDAGALLLERSEPLMMMLESASQELQNLAAEPSGRLRLSVVSSLADGEFTQMLAAYCKFYPKVHLSVEYTNRRVDLIEEAVDLAIRVGSIRDSDLIVRKLRQIGFMVVASPAYWKTHPKPSTPKDLQQHNCIVSPMENNGRSGQGQWNFESAPGKIYAVDVRGQFDATDVRAHRIFALAGSGVAYLPRPVIEEDIAKGLLEPVLNEHMPNDVWLSAVYAQRRHNSAALRALLDFLQTKLRPA